MELNRVTYLVKFSTSGPPPLPTHPSLKNKSLDLFLYDGNVGLELVKLRIVFNNEAKLHSIIFNKL